MHKHGDMIKFKSNVCSNGWGDILLELALISETAEIATLCLSENALYMVEIAADISLKYSGGRFSSTVNKLA